MQPLNDGNWTTFDKEKCLKSDVLWWTCSLLHNWNDSLISKIHHWKFVFFVGYDYRQFYTALKSATHVWEPSEESFYQGQKISLLGEKGNTW